MKMTWKWHENDMKMTRNSRSGQDWEDWFMRAGRCQEREKEAATVLTEKTALVFLPNAQCIIITMYWLSQTVCVCLCVGLRTQSPLSFKKYQSKPSSAMQCFHSWPFQTLKPLGSTSFSAADRLASASVSSLTSMPCSIKNGCRIS